MQNLRVTRVWIWSQCSVVSENHFTVISQRDFTSNFSQDSFAIFVRLNFSVATLNPKILDQSNSFGEDYLNQVLNFRVTSFKGIWVFLLFNIVL